MESRPDGAYPMKSAAGISWQASGGVSSDEQDRRPEVPAGRVPVWNRIVGAKAANRRKVLRGR